MKQRSNPRTVCTARDLARLAKMPERFAPDDVPEAVWNRWRADDLVEKVETEGKWQEWRRKRCS